MPLNDPDRKKLEQAIEQLRADIQSLAEEVPTWVNENTSGTKKYRPMSDQILASAKRLDALVRQHTY